MLKLLSDAIDPKEARSLTGIVAADVTMPLFTVVVTVALGLKSASLASM